MKVTCFTDAVVQAHLNHAVAGHVRTDVSAVIAAKQEGRSIADVVSRTRLYAGEVIVIAGHSTDQTAELAAQSGATVFADGGKGKGDAIRCAIPHLHRPVTVFLDADGSHDPADLPRLLAALSEADLVLGSRWVDGGAVVDWPPWRLALSRGGNRYTRMALGLPVKDATGGFRAFRAEVLRTIPLDAVSSAGYCFQVDLVFRTAKAGFRVREVPITFRERTRGQSKMSGAIVVEALAKVTMWAVTNRGARLRQRVGPRGAT